MEVPAVIPYTIVKSMQAISNVYEMRLLTMILAKAQAGTRTYDARLKDFNIEKYPYNVQLSFPARYLLKSGDRNYDNITLAFGLAQKTIPWHHGDTVRHINVIANPTYEIRQGVKYVSCTIDNTLWLEMTDFASGHRYLDLAVMMRLKSHYSVIMYCLISNQGSTIEYRIETLRRLLGVDDKPAYQDFHAFDKRILSKAKAELDQASPISFHYGGDRHGRGGRYDLIKIQPYVNDSYTHPVLDDQGRVQELLSKRIQLDDRVTDYLRCQYNAQDKGMQAVAAYLPRLGTWQQQIDYLATVRQKALKAGAVSLMAYLHACLKAVSL